MRTPARRLALLGGVAVSVLLAVPAFAQDAATVASGVSATPAAAALPVAAQARGERLAPLPAIDVPFTRFVLPNGLTLIVHEDHKTPVVAVNIWYHVGSKNEPIARSGFAHLFEHLMFNGSEHFNDDWFKGAREAGRHRP